MLVQKYLQTKDVIEIPMPNCYQKLVSGEKAWFDVLTKMYFYKNQAEIFDCFLQILNHKVFICLDTKNKFARQYAAFILHTAPTNIKDKKRRIFKIKKKI